MTLPYLLRKELQQFVRNAFLPRLVILMPLMMMLVLPWAANQEVTDLQLCLVDQDHSPQSRLLATEATSGRYFHLASTVANYTEALREVDAGRADVVLVIQSHFARRLGRGEKAQVFIAANSVNGTKGMMGANYLAQIVATAGGQLMDCSPALKAASGTGGRPVVLSVSNRYNPHLDYKVYMVPAMMVMLLTLLTGFLPALSIVGEKEAGTMEQLNVTPLRRSTFILSKLIPYWIIGLTVMTLCLLLAWGVYGLVPEGSLLTIYAFAAIYILVVSAMGLIISNYSETMQQAVFMMYFFVMILILMSGLFTPVNSMPEWAQWIAACNPLKYFVHVMRSVFLKGSTLRDLLPPLYALLAFAGGLGTWAILSYRKRS